MTAWLTSGCSSCCRDFCCCARLTNSAAAACSSTSLAWPTLTDTLSSSSEVHRGARASLCDKSEVPRAARTRSDEKRNDLQGNTHTATGILGLAICKWRRQLEDTAVVFKPSQITRGHRLQGYCLRSLAGLWFRHLDSGIKHVSCARQVFCLCFRLVCCDSWQRLTPLTV